MTIQIDKTYLVDKMTDMVRINSCNPSLTPGSPGEAEAGAYYAQAMGELGLEVTTHELAENRVNVVGIWPGTGKGKSLLLNAHLDTVGVEGMVGDPFSAEVRDGRLYGRGSQDMKASLAAMLASVKALQDAGIRLAGDLLLTAVADEEHASIGMEDLVKHYSADGAIVTEPTDMKICRAHRGFMWYEVETIGRAAHGSRFQEGIDANMRMGRFLAELDKLEQETLQRPAHPLVGPSSLHAALLKGGSEISSYAAKCTLQIERRICPGEIEAELTRELQAIIDRLAAADETFQATVKPYFERSPFEVAADAHIVTTLEQAMIQHLGTAPEHMGATFWTDAALLADAGIETVVAGPTGQGLHSKEEWVELQSVYDFTHILAESAIAFCGM